MRLHNTIDDPPPTTTSESPAAEVATAELVRRVYEGTREERRAAEAVLLDGRLERTDALIAVLQRENKKKPKRFAWFAVGFIALMIVVIGGFSALLSGEMQFGGFGYPMWMGAAALAATFAPTGLQKRAATALSDSDDIRAVPPLIEALDKQDSATKAAASKALIRLIPRLHANHDEMLADSHLRILNEQMAKADNKEFTLTVLSALTQIGDERFLPTVKSWSEGKGAAKKNAQIREASTTTLPYLEQRTEKQKEAKTLLRAASAVSATSDTLLRPAGAATECDPASLLRPVESDTSSETRVTVSESDDQTVQASTTG